MAKKDELEQQVKGMEKSLTEQQGMCIEHQGMCIEQGMCIRVCALNIRVYAFHCWCL